MEVVVVLGHVCEDAEAVRYSQGHHVLRIQESRYPQLLLGHTERQFVVLIDIFFLQRVKIYELGPVSVNEGAEGQAVPEARRHVGDAHVPVALALEPTPLLQRLHRRHPGAAGGAEPRGETEAAVWRAPAGHTHTGSGDGDREAHRAEG